GLDIPQSVIASGGDTSSGGTLSLTGTIGQPVAGDITGGSFVLSAGFLKAELPDLTATKSDDVAGNSTVGSSWTWNIHITNIGAGPANFDDTNTILIDNLPDTAINYGSVVVNNGPGAAGVINCGITGSDLTCTASGAVTIDPSGSLDIQFSATPTASGTFNNPRAGGSCAVNPNGNITETDTTNNSCSDTVNVASAPVQPDLRASKTDNVAGNAFAGAGWIWTIHISNNGSGSADFADGQRVFLDNLPGLISYGPPSVANASGLTGTVSCHLDGTDVSCSASGAVSLAGGGSFDVQIGAFASSTGTFANPAVAGICAVSPAGAVTESDSTNDSCSETLIVADASVVYTDPAGTCSGNTPCFTSIQTAIESVASGGTVNVGPGNYNEGDSVDRPVNVNINGDITVTDWFMEDPGATVNGGSANMSLTGNWENDAGTFNAGTGTVSFVSSDAVNQQTIGGSNETTFNNLVINNTGAGAVLSDNETVDGVL